MYWLWLGIIEAMESNDPSGNGWLIELVCDCMYWLDDQGLECYYCCPEHPQECTLDRLSTLGDRAGSLAALYQHKEMHEWT